MYKKFMFYFFFIFVPVNTSVKPNLLSIKTIKPIYNI